MKNSLEAGVWVNELVKQANDLAHNIKLAKKEIDNPVLYTSILSELRFLVEHLEEE